MPLGRVVTSRLNKILRLATTCLLAVPIFFTFGSSAQAQINVISVDCTPFVSPGPTSFGNSNTMGMSLQQVDPGAVLFSVNEVTPAAFRALTVAQFAAYDLIAINNNPIRLGDGCVAGAGAGLGTTWHSVIGINSGGRVHLNSHDAPRFKIIVPPGSTPFSAACPGCEPFAADDLVRQGALWAGGGSRTGLLIFNDSARFGTVGGQGWGNPELNLPATWGISDSDQFNGGSFTDGGYTQIVPVFAAHPIYAGLTDARLAPNSVSSFAANIVDDSFHSVFGSFNPVIFTATEQMINTGTIDVGGFNAAFGFGTYLPPQGPDGLAVSLIRDEETAPDHYRCYDVKEQTTLPRQNVTLSDQFLSDEVEVRKAKSLCVPVDKNGEGITDPVYHLTCYDIKKQRDAGYDVVVSNQFGEQELSVEKGRTLCVPSLKEVIGPSDDDDSSDDDSDDDDSDD